MYEVCTKWRIFSCTVKGYQIIYCMFLFIFEGIYFHVYEENSLLCRRKSLCNDVELFIGACQRYCN